ncbi:hypothetical protein [Streptomyces sp. G-G2]|uniref:hypothetical protein n=1 Tax=Streptomyces sp. G-G2 TaxID=3046201 RepID=UPI0024B93E2F|nr:hypothetical protein [Streptomyces sp. G-G2]MDJ0379933.1 hypothetical protein [Streptomyces sp. G-G2]
MRRFRAPLAALVLLVPALFGAGPGAAVPGPSGSGATGETISLRGNLPGELLDVTLTDLTDPAAPLGAGSAADPADRLVAVGFRLRNTGTATYTDAPRGGSYLLGLDGTRYRGVAVPTTAGDPFPDPLPLPPGASAEGSVTFELPQDARLSAVQFAWNSGSADDIGQWNLS